MKRILTLFTIMVLSVGMVCAQTKGTQRKQTTTSRSKTTAKRNTTRSTTANGSSAAKAAPASPQHLVSGSVDGHDYVIIGGIKWATMNVGAKTIAGSYNTCCGDYFAWSETKPRYTSKKHSGDGATFGGWVSGHNQGYSDSDRPSYTSDIVDSEGNMKLDASHDAATQNWGSNWRMPTHDDFLKLNDACYVSNSWMVSGPEGTTSTTDKGIYWCTNYNGVAGLLFSDGENQIFFPATSHALNQSLSNVGLSCFYWTSSRLFGDESCASSMNFYMGTGFSNGASQYFGCSVRAVVAE